MNSYELISPISGKPCGVFVCGKCNLVTPKDLVDKCCKPCECGKPAQNRFGDKCGDCQKIDYRNRMAKRLEEAELVEWDGESMIFSEEVQGYRDGWFYSPEDIMDYFADEGLESKPEYAFLGRKVVKGLDIDRAIEEMTEDTYDGAELHVTDDDWRALLAAVDAFNAKYQVVYFEHDYTKKVRVFEPSLNT